MKKIFLSITVFCLFGAFANAVPDYCNTNDKSLPERIGDKIYESRDIIGNKNLTSEQKVDFFRRACERDRKKFKENTICASPYSQNDFVLAAICHNEMGVIKYFVEEEGFTPLNSKLIPFLPESAVIANLDLTDAGYAAERGNKEALKYFFEDMKYPNDPRTGEPHIGLKVGKPTIGDKMYTSCRNNILSNLTVYDIGKKTINPTPSFLSYIEQKWTEYKKANKLAQITNDIKEAGKEIGGYKDKLEKNLASVNGGHNMNNLYNRVRKDVETSQIKKDADQKARI